jgi:hypothetical protein
MKLNIVPARTGITWVKLGIQTFFKQPLAMAGLFFLYMTAGILLSLVPVFGLILAPVIVPAATLGLMAASQEALKGKFPMPTVLISAFRAGRQRVRSMLVLGSLYAAACLLIMMVVPLLVDAPPTLPVNAGREAMMTPEYQLAMMKNMSITLLMYFPVLVLFWHAPALVHWHGVSPVKSLFFSLVACVRNAGAFVMYGLGWAVVFLCMVTVLGLVGSLTGSVELAATAMLPILLILPAMVSASIYFTFRDSFVTTLPDDSSGNVEDAHNIDDKP